MGENYASEPTQIFCVSGILPQLYAGRTVPFLDTNGDHTTD